MTSRDEWMDGLGRDGRPERCGFSSARCGTVKMYQYLHGDRDRIPMRYKQATRSRWPLVRHLESDTLSSKSLSTVNLQTTTDNT